MRLTYLGNQRFSLPDGKGGFTVWAKDETHPVDPEVWEKFSERTDLIAMQKNKVLRLIGDKEKKHPEPEVTKQELPKPEASKAPETTDEKISAFLKLNYRTAIKKMEEMDRDMLLRISSEEKRPSVKKALDELLKG